MIAATSDMQGKNTELESQLRESRNQIKELQENLEAIRYESLNDQLTGLANRKHFDQSLEREAAAAQRRGEPLCLVMCDIDHFKQFNDTHGHQTGDQVLRLVGTAIKGTIKGRDIAARYGGEEFGIILPGTPLQSAVLVADQIRAAIMAKELIKRSTGESLGRITMSFGVAEYREGEQLESFIERADAGLYASKRNGRNRVTDENDPSLIPRKSAVA
jgi:diguanylate cyclase